MIKAFGILVLGALGAFVALSWRDIVRYFRIEEMDWGNGHPEVVPARGRITYLNNGAAEGGGDFTSASRGGPAHTVMQTQPHRRGSQLSS